MEKEKSNYSFQTSLPAYKDNQQEKKFQRIQILDVIRGAGGKATIQQIAEATGIVPSTVSGRMKDLREEQLIIDTGNLVVYKGRKRKEFALVPPVKQAPVNGSPAPMFNYKKNLIK